MIIKSIEINNWRKIDNLKLDFKDSINIVYGPNESGKSTIREAIYYAFFEDYSSSKKEIQNIIPVSTSLNPSVKLEFFAKDKSYIIEKKIKEFAKFFNNSKKQLLAENKNVNQKILEEIDFKKDLIPLFDLLWIKQGKVFDIIENSSNVSVVDFIKEIIKNEYIEKNKLNEDFYKYITKKLFSSYITEDKESLKKKSKLYELQIDKNQKENKIKEIESKIKNLEFLKEQKEKLEKELEEDNNSLKQTKEQLSEKEQEKEKMRDFILIEKQYNSIDKDYNILLLNNNSIEENEKELENKNNEREYLLKKKKFLLEQKLTEYDNIKKNLERVNSELSELENITEENIKNIEKDIEKIKEKQIENEKLNVTLESLGINIEIKPLKDNVKLKIKKDEEEPHKDYYIQKPTEIKAARLINIISDDFELNITGPLKLKEEDFKKITQNLKQNLEDIEKIFKKYNFDNIEKLKTFLEEEKQKISKKNKLLQEKEREEIRLKSYNHEYLQKELTNLNSIQAINCSEDLNNINENLRKIELDINTIEEKKKSSKETNNQILEKYGKNNKKDFENEYLEKRKEFELKESKLNNKIDLNTLNKEIEELKNKKEELNSAILDISQKKTKIETQLNESNNLVSEKEELEKDLKIISENLKEEYVTFYSLKYLKKEIERKKNEMEDNIFKQLENNLISNFEKINNNYKSFSITKDLQIEDSIELSDNKKLSINNLSYGTKEQLALIFRLILAETISKKESIPIILDDTLVNTDKDRFKKVMELITKDLKDKIQFIIFTCHDNYIEYKDFNFIELPKLLEK